MENENATAEPSVNTAPEVNKEPETPQVDLDTKVGELTEIVTKLSEAYQKKETDYQSQKKRAEKAEGKLKEEGLEIEDEKPSFDPESVATMIEQSVQKAVANFIPAAKQEEEDLLAKAQTKISELTLAVKNRAGVIPASPGSNLDRSGAGEPNKYASAAYWSPTQIADLEKRGLNPDTVYKNMQLPGSPSNPQPPQI